MDAVGVKQNALVFDPYMGSASCGVACVRTGRRYIGIEIEEAYCEIAAKRIISAKAQGLLEFQEVSP
jgi:site-specific DNA-methyltransferase (adenine-specific)